MLDNKVRVIKEIVNATKIPLLGVIGKNNHENNLSVLEKPKSSVSEAFRGVRANLRFLYNEDGKSKVLLVTSSVGGEGKTYVSINIASVLGLSGKKTILLGMDLRKPKICRSSTPAWTSMDGIAISTLRWNLLNPKLQSRLTVRPTTTPARCPKTNTLMTS